MTVLVMDITVEAGSNTASVTVDVDGVIHRVKVFCEEDLVRGGLIRIYHGDEEFRQLFDNDENWFRGREISQYAFRVINGIDLTYPIKLKYAP